MVSAHTAEDCVFGHKRHDRIQAGLWAGYDWRQYLDLPAGWCQGRCDISRTLDLYGVWEWADTRRFVRCLRERPPSEDVVVDVGANLGWYSVWAGLCGFKTLAVEGITETAWIAHSNTESFAVGDLVDVECEWINETTPEIADLHPVRLLKVDIEGLEYEAVRVFGRFFEQRLIEHAMIEVTPSFAEYYDQTMAMVQQLLDYGYKADVDGQPVGVADLERVNQANVWFERKR